MRFEAAWMWIALPVLLLWIWWLSRRSYAQLLPAARHMSVVLRVLILTCLVGALSQPMLARRSETQHVIFLVDVSRSVSAENLEAAMDEIDRLAREALQKHSGHRISLIAFARQARLLNRGQTDWTSPLPQPTRDLILWQTALPQLHSQRAALTASDDGSNQARRELNEHIAALEAFRDSIGSNHTDVGQAIRLALNSGAIDEARTIYIFTDANFNRGDLAPPAQRAGSAAIHVVALDRPIPPEVAAADLILPPSVRVNQAFSADLHVASSIQTAATIVVYKDGYASLEFKAELRPGNNVVKIPGLYFREKGFHTVDVAVRAAQDTRVENNTVKSLVVVPGELRVLYVDGDESQQSYLKSALELEGMQVEARPAAGVPLSLHDLLGFDAFILSNVPADRMSQRQMQMIKTYVQDFGGGFIMLGGEQSFGLGGYYNTPIEEILPVKMPIQKDLMRPALAIMLVIDKSGSMEGVKIQLAKRAAVATAEAINPRDQIGVVGFDSQSRVILELTAAGDRATITSEIASLDAGGGTFLFPALEDAHERLLQSNARRKHVIVLSDGQTQGFGYPDFANAMAADGITISTVGIGEGADMQLMEAIASAGGGRAYFTDDFYSIPQIFTREALRASKSMLVERLVTPMINEDDESVQELDDELPPLTGYVATTPREIAKLIIISDSGDPILAKWRTGLGRAAAFTSETKPRWAEDWIRWPDFAKFWTQLVRSVAGHDVAEQISIEPTHELHEDGVRLSIDLRDTAGNFITDRAVELTMYDASAGSRKLPVQRDAPGRYVAQVPQITYGAGQQFAWHIADESTAARSSSPPSTNNPADESKAITTPFGYVYSFSPEFRTLGPDEQALEQIEAGGGSVMRVGHSTLELSDQRSVKQIRLWPALLALALLLTPLDILCRRLG